MQTRSLKQHLPLTLCLLCVLFLCTYKLTESPPIWMDEGIISQVSRNVAENGVYRLQTGPEEYVSAGFVTTSYPVTIPISLSFKLFGTGLLQARMVMVLFILGLFLATYFLARKQFENPWLLYFTLALIVTFAPLYGHGKNVLGEIPGLLWLSLAFLFTFKIEKGQGTLRNFILAGLFFGLALVTKPIFILIGPSLVFLLWKFRKMGERKKWVWAVVALAVPILIWLPVQFTGDSLGNILSIYVNPHSTELGSSIKDNFLRFFKEAQPMYFFVSMIIWYASIALRWFKKQPITIVEQALAIFAGFVLLAYLRTIGYYRYFFLAQFFSLFYTVQAVLVICGTKISKKIAYVALTLLILFQIYQTFFNSWVAVHYGNHGTEEVISVMKTFPKDGSFYIYQAPELVLFLPNNKYYQYLEVTKTITIGYNTLNVLKEGKAQFVAVSDEALAAKPELFADYKVRQNIGKYIFLEKK
jgi:4-amino-4-deoxy-L-arabinose transferase-like glycosyltransferase